MVWQISQALVQAAQELNMPAGYSTLVTGRGRELERTFTNRLAPLQREGPSKPNTVHLRMFLTVAAVYDRRRCCTVLDCRRS